MCDGVILFFPVELGTEVISQLETHLLQKANILRKQREDFPMNIE